MRIVIDTNVLVAAMLSPHGPPAQVLRLALQGDLVPLHDDRLLSEYREVLSRSRFGFDHADIRAVLEGIELGGELVFAKPLSIELYDPDDLPFLEVAAGGGAAPLVTGNPRRYQPIRGSHGVDILLPRDLVNHLTRGGDEN